MMVVMGKTMMKVMMMTVDDGATRECCNVIARSMSFAQCFPTLMVNALFYSLIVHCVCPLKFVNNLMCRNMNLELKTTFRARNLIQLQICNT